jgi:hypothetical protein
MGTLIADTRHGITQFAGILRRWKWLIVGGVVIALAVGTIAVAAAPSGYDANAVVLVDQPGLSSTPTNGVASAQELIDLMPTVAAVAVSHGVLDGVRSEVGLKEPVAALRSQTQVSVVPNTLTLSLTVHMANQGQATAAARALVNQLDLAVGVLGASAHSASGGTGGTGGIESAPAGTGTGGIGVNRLAVVPLEESAASPVPTHASLTIALAIVIGLAFTIAAAVVLDRS